MIDWLIPQTVETITSRFNGLIKVKKFLGRYAVWIGGYEQSGPMVTNVWEKAFSNLTIQQCNNVLVLGLGCGSVVPLIRDKWPKAKITGVEIDPEMIRLGKKYFNLTDVKIHVTDAHKFIKSTHQKYDLILIDVYKGGKSVENDTARLAEKLVTGGVLLTNRLINCNNYLLISFKSSSGKLISKSVS